MKLSSLFFLTALIYTGGSRLKYEDNEVAHQGSTISKATLYLRGRPLDLGSFLEGRMHGPCLVHAWIHPTAQTKHISC